MYIIVRNNFFSPTGVIIMEAIDNNRIVISWKCPRCGKEIKLKSLKALTLVMDAEACQGCRARTFMEKKPDCIPLILDFWERTDTRPESQSWTRAVPVAACAGYPCIKVALKQGHSKRQLLCT